MQDLTVSIIQTNLVWKDKMVNLASLKNKIGGLSQETDLIVLPEMFNTGFVTEPEDVAETMNASTIDWMREMAGQKECVVTGSLIIREEDGYFNRLIWMQQDGSLQYYNKRHLFSLAGENEKFSQGKEHLVVEIKGWKVMPMICYDLRFPVWSKNRMDGDEYLYDCLIYIANWPSARNHAWKSLLIARAIENLSFAIGVNRTGIDGTGKAYTGDSAVIDPLGHKVAVTEPSEETIITTTLSGSALIEVRKKIPFGDDWDRFRIQ
jgi:predicted amidohydrolase